MAFLSFRYHPDAGEGLAKLLARGDKTFAELKRRIRAVQDEWEPQDDADLQLLVPFEDFFLVFTVAEKDRSILVLAAVEPQPRV
jgi:hypothetical protein